MNIKIIVATHKPYRMPTDPMYLPVFCGAALRKPEEIPEGYQRDDEGENISHKNATYCELTALYWAWKNLPPEVEAVGLCHYRRHFTAMGLSKRNLLNKWNIILTQNQTNELLKTYDVILPRRCDFGSATVYAQWLSYHVSEPLDITAVYVKSLSHAYEKAWNTVMNQTWANVFNMIITKRCIMDRYCAWLFTVLQYVEQRVNLAPRLIDDSRLYGFISERLLDVWIEANNLSFREIDCLFMERRSLARRGFLFLKRKIKSVVLKFSNKHLKLTP